MRCRMKAPRETAIVGSPPMSTMPGRQRSAIVLPSTIPAQFLTIVVAAAVGVGRAGVEDRRPDAGTPRTRADVVRLDRAREGELALPDGALLGARRQALVGEGQGRGVDRRRLRMERRGSDDARPRSSRDAEPRGPAIAFTARRSSSCRRPWSCARSSRVRRSSREGAAPARSRAVRRTRAPPRCSRAPRA